MYNVQLTETELRYFYWRMKTNRWYENYVKRGMKQMPWEPWMADTIEKLEPIYENLKKIHSPHNFKGCPRGGL